MSPQRSLSYVRLLEWDIIRLFFWLGMYIDLNVTSVIVRLGLLRLDYIKVRMEYDVDQYLFKFRYFILKLGIFFQRLYLEPARSALDRLGCWDGINFLFG